MSKLKFVLSDLHLGAGYHRLKDDDVLENFLVDEQLVHLLQQMQVESEQGQREVELIINGDFFEFLQVPAVDNFNLAKTYPPEAYLDSSQEASVKRLNLIVNRHRAGFRALADFMQVETPKRRITIIKGNHDVSLYWPLVKSRLREVLGATGRRSSLLLFAAEFISREKIYVEHGHQQTEQINRYPDFHDPRLPDHHTQLYYPPGSFFYIDLLHEVEGDYWLSQGVKPATALIWFALRWDFELGAKMLAKFIRRVEAATTIPADAELLLNRLEDEVERGRLAHQYQSDLDFRQQFHQQIQPYLSEAAPPPADRSSDPLAFGLAEQEHQQQRLQAAAAEIARLEKADIILFGHSHHAVLEPLADDRIYINTGSWLGLPDLTETRVEDWEALFAGSLKTGNLTIRLPYARIDYDRHDNPTAQLLDFARKKAAPQEPATGPTNFLSRLLSRFGTVL